MEIRSGLGGIPYGFITPGDAPKQTKGVFRLGGDIGAFLQDMQRYRLMIEIEGDYHSSKSEIAKQIADAAIDAGMKVSLVDWEQGGLDSKDTKNSILRNLKPKNVNKIHVSADVPLSIEGLKDVAQYFDMVIVDSATKVKTLNNEWHDELRTTRPNTIWVMLNQRNSKGTTRGGSGASYNAPIVIFTHRPDKKDWSKNYAELEKNRGNSTNLYYLINQKKVTTDKPE